MNLYYNNKITIYLFIFIFFCTLAISILIQKILIPEIFQHKDDLIQFIDLGLIVPDSIYFHNLAVEQLLIMNKVGFLEGWKIKIEANFPPALASAVYYFFGVDPIYILPINSLIHACSTCIFLLIINYFFNIKLSVFLSLVFAFNPQVFEWVSQLHKDGIFVLGSLLFIKISIEIIINLQKNISTINKLPKIVCLFLLSIGLIWLSRPYMLNYVSIFFVLSIFISLYYFFSFNKNLDKFILLITLSSLLSFNIFIIYSFVKSEKNNIKMLAAAKILNNCSTEINQNKNEACPLKAYKNKLIYTAHIPKWNTSFLPNKIESAFYKINIARYWSIQQKGNSVYSNKIFESTYELTSYTPIALFYGLFSPLPNLWSGDASNDMYSLGRKLMGVFSVFSFICIPFILYGLITNKRKLPFTYLILYCFGGIVLFTLVSVNVGTIIRYRYVYHSIIFCLGFGYLSRFLFSKFKRNKK
ncbi:hypothetical protein N8870_05300 [Alphaproteobacteria bacterium]|nr:hypothetical protein [Alphaproteobacteria bacterium]